MQYNHIPAMPVEVAYYLNCMPGKVYVDCTLGGCGHAIGICKKIIPGGLFIGIDQDMDAIKNAEEKLKPYKSSVRLFNDNFINLKTILSHLNISSADGILLDLGLSLYQLESSGRGFSFQRNEPLDMRMNIQSGITAEGIINKSSEESLRKIFSDYGEERRAKQIARKIVKIRKDEPIRTSAQLAGIVVGPAKKGKSAHQRIHPATRVFMALRIAVNRELERLESFMENVAGYLNPGGRLCVLSFHSLEDRIVKHRIKALEKGCTCPPRFPKCVCNKKSVLRSLTKKVIRPTKEEIAKNPMARSTRLRAAERI
ncbi:MAG: 16S rRNA (cytosine(1402)-N(4))-methyltransferase RsmH [Thermodesulfobacteriota bacterium]|nr:16S rRNA (cytosine(1402)-N(4))-methyltransferase RsmH [Thermodesulfobacteriota bacterium]